MGLEKPEFENQSEHEPNRRRGDANADNVVRVLRVDSDTCADGPRDNGCDKCGD